MRLHKSNGKRGKLGMRMHADAKSERASAVVLLFWRDVRK
jgi:hypothetical protein